MTPGFPSSLLLFSSLDSPVPSPSRPLNTPGPTSTLSFGDAPLRIDILEAFGQGLGQRECDFPRVGQTLQ